MTFWDARRSPAGKALIWSNADAGMGNTLLGAALGHWRGRFGGVIDSLEQRRQGLHEPEL